MGQPARVVIVGGGVMGAATACFLARDHGLQPIVIERDPTYLHASSALSASSIRQQFSVPINIALSQASLAFYRAIGTELAVGQERLDIALTEPGYLYLATPRGVAHMQTQHALQRHMGADIALLAPEALAVRFPWLAVGDIALGSWGQTGEGWFDGWSVLQAFRRKALACGARFVKADVVALDGASQHAHTVRCQDGQQFEADHVVLAAGAWSAALLAPLGFELPVQAHKRDVFVVDAPVRLNDCPLVIDPSGVWFRPEGAGAQGRSRYIMGAPPRHEDRHAAPLHDIDHDLFDDVIWPTLAERVPAFEALRQVSAWAGYYEMNTFDHNGLVGAWPGWPNLHLACGFSGHGMQQAPAVGRAVAHQIACGTWGPLDVSALSPARIAQGEPLREQCII